jgi:hypothetical protein
MNRQRGNKKNDRAKETWYMGTPIEHWKNPEFFRHTVLRRIKPFVSKSWHFQVPTRSKVYSFIMQCACIGKRVNKKLPKRNAQARTFRREEVVARRWAAAAAGSELAERVYSSMRPKTPSSSSSVGDVRLPKSTSALRRWRVSWAVASPPRAPRRSDTL